MESGIGRGGARPTESREVLVQRNPVTWLPPCCFLMSTSMSETEKIQILLQLNPVYQALLDPKCFCIYTDLNAQKLFVGWIRIGYGYGMEISERTSAMSTIMITMSNTQRHTG